ELETSPVITPARFFVLLVKALFLVISLCAALSFLLSIDTFFRPGVHYDTLLPQIQKQSHSKM
ncbi:MAG: hypothetical protein VX318_06820, partial [Pseudomonadota bacterium]|nr:hypothetical protein [Pseudomonadota bacterium]